MIHLLLGPVVGLTVAVKITAAPTLRLALFSIFILTLIIPFLGQMSIISWKVDAQFLFRSNNNDDDDSDDIRIINAAPSPSQPSQEQLVLVVSGEGENQKFLMVLPPSMTPRNSRRRLIQSRVIRLRR